MNKTNTLFDLFNSEVSSEEKSKILSRLQLAKSSDLDSALDCLLIHPISSMSMNELEKDFSKEYDGEFQNKLENSTLDFILPIGLPQTALTALRNSFDTAFEEAEKEISSYSDLGNASYLDSLLIHTLNAESKLLLLDVFNETLIGKTSKMQRLNLLAQEYSGRLIWGLIAIVTLSIFTSLLNIFDYSTQKRQIIRLDNSFIDGNTQNSADTALGIAFQEKSVDSTSFKLDSLNKKPSKKQYDIKNWLVIEHEFMKKQAAGFVDKASDDTVQRFLGSHKIMDINSSDLLKLSPYASMPRGNTEKSELRRLIRSKNLLYYFELHLMLQAKDYKRALSIANFLLTDADKLLDPKYSTKEKISNSKVLQSTARIYFGISIILSSFKEEDLGLLITEWKNRGIINDNDFDEMRTILDIYSNRE